MLETIYSHANSLIGFIESLGGIYGTALGIISVITVILMMKTVSSFILKSTVAIITVLFIITGIGIYASVFSTAEGNAESLLFSKGHPNEEQLMEIQQ